VGIDPGIAALLVAADALAAPGVVQVATDPARLLAPLGTIDEPAERARLLAELLPDAVVPLGTLVMLRGARGRSAGHLRLAADGSPVELDLAAGGLALVDLPPGQAASVELTFRSPVDLGVRGRRFAVRATGGLAGLVVDLRDTPLRLPERTDERRTLLPRGSGPSGGARPVNGLALVPARQLLVERPLVRVPLVPGDRILVGAGTTVAPGDLLAERVRDARLVEVGDVERRAGTAHPGAWVAAEPGRRGTAPAGELLFEHEGRRRIATGPHPDLVAAPAGGGSSRSTPASRSSSSSRESASQARSCSATLATGGSRSSATRATGGSRSTWRRPARSSSSPGAPTPRR